MKKLHKLLLLSYIGPFVMTFVVVMFIFIMQWFWKYIDELVGKGLEWYVISEITFYASANIVPLALPLAVLLSSIMLFGNLGEHYELVSIKSAGISLQRAMIPLIAFTIVVSIAAFFFSNNLWPKANLKFAELLYSIRQVKPALDIKPGVFYSGIENFAIRVARKDKDGYTLYDVLIFDDSDSKAHRVVKAEKGTMVMSEDERYLILSLYNGSSYEERKPDIKNRDSYPLFRSDFKEEVFRFNLSGFQLERSDEEMFKDNYQMLNLVQLEAAVDTLNLRFEERRENYAGHLKGKMLIYKDTLDLPQEYDDSLAAIPFLDRFADGDKVKILDAGVNQGRSAKTYVQSMISEFESRETSITRHEIEWHRKFALSIACLILFFIGAPLGAIIRKGGFGMPTIVSILLFILFYVMNVVGEKLAKNGDLEPFTGMWLSTFCLLPVGVFLTQMATTDAAILEADTYKRFFAKITGRSSQKA